MKNFRITSPIDDETIEKLTAGTQVLISGIVYTARDAAHQRLVQALDRGEPLPFDLKGQTLYYMGPSPARPGQVIGSAGPTTSSRMDAYTPRLLAAGIRAMIGKGSRSPAVREAVKKYKAVYFAAIGGAGALLAQSIKKAEVIAYDDLGTEAIRRLTLENFPAIVADDIYGEDLFEQSKAKYRRERKMKDCVFCQIVAGKIPSKTLYQDKEVIAFRDINPVAPTHVLIIPKKHLPSLIHLSDDETPLIGHMVKVANQLAREEGVAESGFRLVISSGKQGGQVVPHLHMHLIGGRQLAGGMG